MTDMKTNIKKYLLGITLVFGIFAVAAYYIMGTKSEDIYKNVKEYKDDRKGKNPSYNSEVE